MQQRLFHRYFLLVLFSALLGGNSVHAQGAPVKWTPEEQKELFNYCEKPELIRQLKISADIADKIGEIDNWALLQKLSVAANTNEAYATPREVDEDALKKYKALRLSADQVKTLVDLKRARTENPSPCAAITFSYNRVFDTLSPQRALVLYKTPYRKLLIDKLGINGRQADMLFETEIWKQKEALNIAAIPENDFNRIRRTVAMNNQRESRYRATGLNDEQIAATIQFFTEHQIGPKQ
jgi:hypothetical protein